MQWITFIVISTLYYGSCKDCDLAGREVVRPEIKLQRDLFDDYDILEPKCNNTSGVEVVLDYVVEAFFLSPDEEVLTINARNMFRWQDDRLKWEADKYGGLKVVRITNIDIGAPMLTLKNDATEWSGYGSVDLGTCQVRNRGLVQCIVLVQHSVPCSSNLQNWPYDVKTCILKFDKATIFHDDAKVILKAIHLGFVMKSEFGNGWRITKSTIKKNMTGDHRSVIGLYLVRKAECLEASIVIPSFVVFVLTMTSMFLHVNNDVRLGILWLNVLNHFAIISEINQNIPRYGSDVPVILLFMSWSTILTILIALLTFLLRYISKSRTPPPSFLVNINSLVLNGSGRHLVVPRWNVEILDKSVLDSLNHCTEWMNFSNIVNSISLYVTLTTYFVLFSINLPCGSPYRPENNLI